MVKCRYFSLALSLPTPKNKKSTVSLSATPLATSYPTTLGDFTLFGFNPSHSITFPDFKAVCKKLALRFGTRLVSGLSHVRRSCSRCYFIGIIGVEAAT
jgi:hypothetical protein